ncbi:MAG: nucleotidyltransferase domain-containing protein [Chloroflexi bacterium]|nr:nucleotidyltransferase domain-containing protein [Chloroflexota bacterium]
MNLTNRIPEITQRIIQTSNPEKIILFGSYARGDFGADSDLNILIIVPGVKHLRQESIRVRRALRGLLAPVDIVVATPEQITRLRNEAGLMYQSALSEGKVLYERAI